MATEKTSIKQALMAGEFEHIKGKGNRFSSTNQPTRNGRKKSLFRLAKDAQNIGSDEFKRAAGWLLALSRDEVQEIANDPTKPVYLGIIARALLMSGKRGDLRPLMEIIERLFGKPTQPVDVSTNKLPEIIFTGVLSPEEEAKL